MFLVFARLHQHAVVFFEYPGRFLIGRAEGIEYQLIPLGLAPAGRQLFVEFFLRYACPVERVRQRARHGPHFGRFVGRFYQRFDGQRVAERAIYAGGYLRPLDHVLLAHGEGRQELRGLGSLVGVAEYLIEFRVRFLRGLRAVARGLKCRVELAHRRAVFLRGFVQIPQAGYHISNAAHNCGDALRYQIPRRHREGVQALAGLRRAVVDVVQRVPHVVGGVRGPVHFALHL